MCFGSRRLAPYEWAEVCGARIGRLADFDPRKREEAERERDEENCMDTSDPRQFGPKNHAGDISDPVQKCHWDTP